MMSDPFCHKVYNVIDTWSRLQMYFVHIELYFEIYRINNAIICNNDAVDLIRVTFHKF